MAQILLIESDHLLAKNLIKFLSGLNHKVSWHVDPQDAIEYANQSQPDVVILDIILANRRNGIEFLYEFRSYPEWQDLPVVIFSCVAAENLKGCLEAMHQLRISAYRYKPTTSMRELAQTVDQALQPSIA